MGATWVVVDTRDVEPGEQCPVLGRFETEKQGAEFIGTLPDAETGRYGLDRCSEGERGAATVGRPRPDFDPRVDYPERYMRDGVWQVDV